MYGTADSNVPSIIRLLVMVH